MASKETLPLSRTSAIPSRRTARPRLWLAYSLAVAITVFTLFVRLIVLGYRPTDPPGLIFFLLPIIISAYLGGVGPGLVATVLSVIFSRYFLLAPVHSFSVDASFRSLQWLALLSEGVLISVLNEALQRSQRRSGDRAALQEQLAKIAATAPGAICSYLRRPDGSSCFPYAS